MPAGKSGGINIVELPLRLPPPKAAPTKNRMALAGSLITPTLLEGNYQVKITKGKETFVQTIALAPDPESIYSKADRSLQQKNLKILYDLTNELGYIYFALEDMHQKASLIIIDHDPLKEKLIKFANETKKFKDSLVSLEGDFYVAEGEEAIREEISQLYYSISRYPGKPSQQQIQKTQDLQDQFVKVKKRFEEIEDQAKQINIQLIKSNTSPISWRSMEDYLR